MEKERLLGELMRSQKEFESMKHSFESKLQVDYQRVAPSPVALPLMCNAGDAKRYWSHNSRT